MRILAGGPSEDFKAFILLLKLDFWISPLSRQLMHAAVAVRELLAQYSTKPGDSIYKFLIRILLVHGSSLGRKWDIPSRTFHELL